MQWQGEENGDKENGDKEEEKKEEGEHEESRKRKRDEEFEAWLDHTELRKKAFGEVQQRRLLR